MKNLQGLTNLNTVRFASQFSGADAGAKIVAAIADLPTTGGMVVADFEGAQSISQDIFASVTKPGVLIFYNAIFSVSARQNVPANWSILGAYGGGVDGSSDANVGTVFRWTGGNNTQVFKFLDTEFTRMEGFTVDCQSTTGLTAILVDSDNAPAAHDNRFQFFVIHHCPIGMQFGTSGAVGRQSDAWTVRHFKISKFTTAAIRINSQNAAQQAVIESGFIQEDIGNAANLIDIQGLFASANLSVRDVAFAQAPGGTGSALNLSWDATSGGSPTVIENNSFEMGLGAAITASTNDTSGGNLILIGNQFGNGAINITGNRNVVSIGNTWQGATSATLSNSGSKLVSIGDVFSTGSWVTAAGQPVVLLNDLTSGTLIPLRIKGGNNKVIGLIDSAQPDPYVELKNTSSTPGTWAIDVSGTGGLSPGDFLVKDQINARTLFGASKDTGGFWVGASRNGFMSPGDLSVGRNANGGAIFFTTATQASLDYGLTAAGKFNFTGGIVQMPSGATVGEKLTVSGASGDDKLLAQLGPAVTALGAVAQSYANISVAYVAALNAPTNRPVAALGVNESNTAIDQYGLYGVVVGRHSSGTKANITGVAGDVYNEAAGNVTTLAGLKGFAQQDGVGTVATMASLYSFRNLKTAGTVTANYGLYIEDQSGLGSSNYAIFTAGSAPSQFGGAVISGLKTVTFSATPTFDASLGNTQKITLTGNVTSSTLSNATAGETIDFIICQDATGGRTFTWPTNVLGGMTIGATASKCSAQSFVFDGTNAYALGPGSSNM